MAIDLCLFAYFQSQNGDVHRKETTMKAAERAYVIVKAQERRRD